MKKFFGIVIGVFLTASIANANPVFEQYIDWIVNNSDFKYNGEPLPTLKRTSKESLQILLYGETAIEESQRHNRKLPEVLAIYDEKNKKIMLPYDTDISDFSNHHTIVHELVHYLQDINGITEDCVGLLEVTAYDLQRKWQDAVDHPAPRPDELFVFMLTRPCNNPHL